MGGRRRWRGRAAAGPRVARGARHGAHLGAVGGRGWGARDRARRRWSPHHFTRGANGDRGGRWRAARPCVAVPSARTPTPTRAGGREARTRVITSLHSYPVPPAPVGAGCGGPRALAWPPHPRARPGTATPRWGVPGRRAPARPQLSTTHLAGCHKGGRRGRGWEGGECGGGRRPHVEYGWPRVRAGFVCVSRVVLSP